MNDISEHPNSTTNFYDVHAVRSLAHEINYICIRGFSLVESLKGVTKMLANQLECNQIRIWLKEGRGFYSWGANSLEEDEIFFGTVSNIVISETIPSLSEYQVELDYIARQVLRGSQKTGDRDYTARGSFWSNNLYLALRGTSSTEYLPGAGQYQTIGIRTLVLLPVLIGIERVGLLMLAYETADLLTKQDLLYLEDLAETVGITFAQIRTQTALRERVKELTCLSGISRIIEKPDKSLAEILSTIVELLPPAWQYPEIARARILFDGNEFSSPDFTETASQQQANLIIQGEIRGSIEVCYEEIRQELDEGPFLIEERHLINTIARQISINIERKETAAEKEQLRHQIRHADRLSTIGQLAAGVAHEINEPLGNVLGFAQLAMKNKQNPVKTQHDLSKIVEASLHAREVIRKLLNFARQVPSQHSEIDLSSVVHSALYFFESRFIKSGIELVKKLASGLPPLKADPIQLSQVLINLVVNSMHSLPDGGTITISTSATDDEVVLAVEDTGCGISDEIKNKIFIPFFTTKDVDEGTGLGLAVVHGIVTAHKGKIEVFSEPGKGTRVELRFPISSEDNPEG